jgi:hypothetical protein
MNRIVVACCVLAAGIGHESAALGHPTTPAHDPAAAVRAVFAAKCVECHGAELARPKGKFGYVLDLGRVAGTPEKVVPFKPEESKLWQLIRDGEMPPDGARAGPLTERQKEAVRAWIAAGAPAEESPGAHGTAPSPNDADEPTTPASPVRRVLILAGKLHLLFVHFPIALLLAAAAAELWSAWRAPAVLSQVGRYSLLLGAAAAVPTVLFGWLYASAGNGASLPGVLALHRWIGAAGACAVVAAVGAEIDARRGARTWRGRALVLGAALFVGAAAHFGGLLVHGDDFFQF